MKVTTDGCLFGAYAAHWSSIHLVEHLLDTENKKLQVLDIGAGTGLLSLMLAQKNNVQINAVEIDEAAAEQSAANFDTSFLKNNFTIFQIPIQTFAQTADKKYDLIISNPPFYEQQLKGDNLIKNTAHHSTALTLNELFVAVNKLLQTKGYFIVLLPFYRTAETIEIAEENNLFLREKVLVKQTPKHNYFRSILIFSTCKNENIIEEIITIKDANNEYTQRFKELLKDYYLQF